MESGDHFVFDPALDHRPYFVFVSGAARPPFLIEADEVEIDRRVGAHLQLDEPAVSRTHAVFRRAEHGKFVLEDQSIVNRRSSTASHCCDRPSCATANGCSSEPPL